MPNVETIKTICPKVTGTRERPEVSTAWHLTLGLFLFRIRYERRWKKKWQS